MPMQPSIKWLPEVISPYIKRPGCEVDQSSPSNVEVKDKWSYTSAPPLRPRLHGMDRYNFKILGENTERQ